VWPLASAFKNKSVFKPVLDSVIDNILPSPSMLPPIKGILNDKTKLKQRPGDDEAPFAALVAFEKLPVTLLLPGHLTSSSLLLRCGKTPVMRYLNPS